jgi:hypothetical protein
LNPYADHFGLPEDDPQTDAGWDSVPDLATQLEDILHAIWLAEAEWRLDDRIDLATR